MALTHTPPGELGSHAPDFSLRGIQASGVGAGQGMLEQTWKLADFTASKALVVSFICNHCPYVIAVQGRINDLAREFGPQGVAFVGINSNDSVKYPDDSFESMKVRAREVGYVFPYLVDDTQEVARAYGAVCTPDFFVYAREGTVFALRYRGRLDDSWKDASLVKRQELAAALEAILGGKQPYATQTPSMGCSIKWRAN